MYGQILNFLFLIKIMSKFIILLFVVLLSVYLTEQKRLFGQDLVDEINSKSTTWKAKLNFPEIRTKEQIIRSVRTKPLIEIPEGSIKEDDELYAEDSEIPAFFDARLKWKNCKTIGQVRNQGSCNSNWAHGSTGAFADRLCIATNGYFNELLSADDLMFCYSGVGSGCDGGYGFQAWKSFQKNGVVTGGNYNTTDGCKPYRIPPCNDTIRYNVCYGQENHGNEECVKRCYGDKLASYTFGRYKTKDWYFLSNDTMQKDIMLYGPIETSIFMEEDFVYYSSGVYQSQGKKFLELLSVKVIGWGEENGTLYWLCVNSWGEQWGDHGMFKILRGADDCEVETYPTAGVPLLELPSS